VIERRKDARHVAGRADGGEACLVRERGTRQAVRIMVVVAIRLVRLQSTEARKGFMRIVISHE